jgi:hypothetical protein
VRDGLFILGFWSVVTLTVLGVMWILDTRIKRSQGTLPSQPQRGFQVKNLNPAEPERSAGTETNKSED